MVSWMIEIKKKRYVSFGVFVMLNYCSRNVKNMRQHFRSIIHYTSLGLTNEDARILSSAWEESKEEGLKRALHSIAMPTTMLYKWLQMIGFYEMIPLTLSTQFVRLRSPCLTKFSLGRI